MANHLAMAALLEPGDEVLIEHPAYGLLLDAALYLEARGEALRAHRRERLRRWTRRRSGARITPKTKLIVITNLHNPSSVLTPDAVLREVGDIARSVGARVLVDEVYLDAVYENTPRTSFHLGPEFVVTSSLTKVYGVSGLRCGWILAEPELARANVAAERPVRRDAGASGRTAERGGVRASGRDPRAGAPRSWRRTARRCAEFLDAAPACAARAAPSGARPAFCGCSGATPTSFCETLRAEHETVGGAGALLRHAGSLPHRHGGGFGDVRRRPARRLGLHLLNHLQ